MATSRADLLLQAVFVDKEAAVKKVAGNLNLHSELCCGDVRMQLYLLMEVEC